MQTTMDAQEQIRHMVEIYVPGYGWETITLTATKDYRNRLIQSFQKQGYRTRSAAVVCQIVKGYWKPMRYL